MIVPAHSIAIGYHGCDRKIGESLLSGKTAIRFSENTYDWLGHGAYFWCTKRGKPTADLVARPSAESSSRAVNCTLDPDSASETTSKSA